MASTTTTPITRKPLWYYDTRASIHISGDQKCFHTLVPLLGDKQTKIGLAGGSVTYTTGKETVILKANGKIVLLENMHYLPNAPVSLFSSPKVDKSGHSVLISKGVAAIQRQGTGETIAVAKQPENRSSYVLECDYTSMSENAYSSTNPPSQHYAQHSMNYLPQKCQTAPKLLCEGAQPSRMSRIQENSMTVDHSAISLDMTIVEMEITSVSIQQPIVFTPLPQSAFTSNSPTQSLILPLCFYGMKQKQFLSIMKSVVLFALSTASTMLAQNEYILSRSSNQNVQHQASFSLRLTSVFHAGVVSEMQSSVSASASSDPILTSKREAWSQSIFQNLPYPTSSSKTKARLADPSLTFLKVLDLDNDDSFLADSQIFTVDAVTGSIPRWSGWDEAEDFEIFDRDMLLPNVSDSNTVRTLAQMTSNSYAEPGGSGWVDLPPYNLSDRFGWQSDGIRGYVFSNDAKDLLVIALKGTSLTVPIVGGGPTAPRDKFNDNIMFSCCCGKVSSSWTPVCECADSATSSCDMSCMNTATSFSNSYYNLANTIYMAVNLWYPSSSKNIWLTGHSLGGSLASLVGLTHDLPVFAYEAPGDFMYAMRIGLIPDLQPTTKSNSNKPQQQPQKRKQQDPAIMEDIASSILPTYSAAPLFIRNYTSFLETLEIYHIGNLKDPIYMGECVTSGNLCWIVGYALESKCHSGKKCLYDNLGADLDVRYHSIDKVIAEYMPVNHTVPECHVFG
ncbi:putative lipase atg15, partial [Physocladia obscura]